MRWAGLSTWVLALGCSPAAAPVDQAPIGALCNTAGACKSGHCADGVCCDSACDGACEACNQLASTGRCAPAPGIPAGEACGPGATCSHDGRCAGATAWARLVGGAGAESVAALAACDGGDVVLAGDHSGDLDLGSGSLGAGGVFVARFNPTGAIRFATGVPGNVHATAVACTAAGAVVAGRIHGVVERSDAAGGADDAFAATVDAGGLASLEVLGGPGNDAALAVAVDAAGRTVLAGSFTAPLTLDRVYTAADGFTHGFVAALDGGGVAWSWTIASAGHDVTAAIAASPDGDVVVGGAFSAPAVTAAGTALEHVRAEEGFVARLSPSGVERWVNVLAGFGSDSVRALALAPDGDIVLGGFFTKTMHAGGPLLDSLGCEDVLVARLGPDGAHRWSTSFGDDRAQVATSVAIAPDGSVVVGGDTFGDLDLRSSFLPWHGDVDAFAVVVVDGVPSWGAIWGDGGSQRVGGVAFSTSGIVVGGTDAGGIDFGAGTMTSAGGFDGFVASLAK